MRNAELFLNKIKGYESNIAINYSDSQYTFKNLSDKIDLDYVFLKEIGVLPGQLVFILGDYSFESIALFFALTLNKNIIIPVTTEIESEIHDRLNESNPEWIFNLRNNTHEELKENSGKIKHELIQKIQNEKASGLILFSSGSTGRPKAMVHNLDILIGTYLERKSKSINFLVFLMFDHIGGLNTLLNCLSMGATVTIPQSRRPDDICELIQKYKINVLPSSPTFLNLSLIAKSFETFDVSSLLMITYGTEPMPESLLVRLKDALPKVKFLQTFGTSETGIAKTTSKSSTSTLLKIDDTDQEYKVVDGELWLRSKTQVLGYINYSNESFTEDGWFKTGDLVEATSDGYLRIVGRSKEVINVGGEKVLPSEIENILTEMEQVIDCKVKGVLNVITGQTVVADIVLAPGYDPKVEKANIRNHCRNKLDAYKVPAKINFVDNISFSDRFKKIRK